ncbi:MAG: hypothetical protein M0R66_07760 [Candidatus Omnitrophica bacterium]|nr:hypothetical protein [Candidatus Omnitrophota bacterium]
MRGRPTRVARDNLAIVNGIHFARITRADHHRIGYDRARAIRINNREPALTISLVGREIAFHREYVAHIFAHRHTLRIIEQVFQPRRISARVSSCGRGAAAAVAAAINKSRDRAHQ